MSNVDATSAGRADFCAFLGLLLRTPPEGPVLDVLEQSSRDLDWLLSDSSGPSLAQAVHLARQDAGTLCQEFEELLRVPAARFLAPYESAWRGRSKSGGRTRGMGLLMGPHTVAVKAYYRAAGFDVADDFREPPDHAALELEFLGHCIREEALAAEHGHAEQADRWHCLSQRFLRDHALCWLPDLASQMREQSRTPFYRLVADLLAGFLRSEAEAMEASRSA